MKALLPTDEDERLKALARYEILDTDAEQEFDDITLLASRICGTPIAAISLIDETRQWFKSKVGIIESETSRDISFCAHGILQTDVFVVEDARVDERFTANPLVTGQAGIRFYAGTPLTASDGHALGMLCVKDRVPRELNPEQKEGLQALSRQVVIQLELRRSLIELKQTVAQLKRAEESLRLLGSAVEQSKESIMITDTELDSPGPSIVFVNPAFTTMTGYTADEAIGRNPRFLQGPRTDRAALSRLRQNLERGEAFAGEGINYRKDGTEFHLDWQIAPIRDASGKATHYVAIQRDITERKRLEAKLIQSQKMETVSKLAGGIAHDFNTILTTIIGHAELIRQAVPSEGSEYQSANAIGTAAGRAALLTQQLLAYGRKQMLQRETLDLNAAVGRSEPILRGLLGEGIEMRVALNAIHPWATMDDGQLQQMLVQLAMNAKDAMPGGGKLTLETGNITFDEAHAATHVEIVAGEYVMIAMTDTGVGISDEIKPRIFEPFFTTKPPGEGTGLGLSMCYGIARQLGGHLSVYSEPGYGTTFKVLLPRMVEMSSGPVVEPARVLIRTLKRGAETILLVEDDAGLRDLAATVLKRSGYTVHVASNGCEAMSVAERLPGIDLLLTDVVMPQMSGTELADRLRSMQPTLKVLFTSAYTEEAIVHHGILDSGIDFLHKPYSPSILAEKMRAALDGGVSKESAKLVEKRGVIG